MNILIIDDDADLNRLLSRFLEKQGYKVHSAGDALQALDLLEQEPDIGMVIVDLMMPYMDGLGFIDAMRADEKHKNKAIIMMSAYSDDKKADHAMRKGAAFFLPKPIDFNRLLTLVKFAE